jgi:hypothetical protein
MSIDSPPRDGAALPIIDERSGRFLRQFLYLGLNEDEQERMVFDGLLVHIAGGKRGGDFNQRFGQPSASLQPNMSNLFPFSDTVTVTGRADGLLERLAARPQTPKIFFTNTSTESRGSKRAVGGIGRKTDTATHAG